MPRYNVYTSEDVATIDAPSWQIRGDGTLVFSGEQTAAAFAPGCWQSVIPVADATESRTTESVIEVGHVKVPLCVALDDDGKVKPEYRGRVAH